MAYELEPFQANGIENLSKALSRCNSVIGVSPGGSGKCLGKDTPVIMFDGTIKMVQDIIVGDKLIGPDSKERNVLSICTGQEMLYRITPVKGDSFVVNESHILSLRAGKCKDNLYSLDRTKAIKNGDIVNISLLDYFKTNKQFKEYVRQWRTPIDFEKRGYLMLEPYFLGIWLGDGVSRRPVITSGDYEIEKYINEFAERNDCLIRKEYNSKNSFNYCLRDKNFTKCGDEGILHLFRYYNLFLNKHIPVQYKTSSEKERLELLAGILDSDGHYDMMGSYDLSLKNERLMDDIIFLCRSLGFACYKKKVKKTCTNNGVEGDYFRISISGNLDRIPCKIERKKASPRKQIKSVLTTSFSIEKIGVGDYYGFEIDGDRLFVLGDFTVTHNTVIICEVCDRFIKKSTQDILILVHRKELLENTRIRLFNEYGIFPQKIDAKTNTIQSDIRVFVAMVETFDRRADNDRFLDSFKNIGLIIIDEAHLNNFNKIFIHFPLAKRLAFTATPIAATKKDPLKNRYGEIVIIAKPSELLTLNMNKPNRGIVPCMAYSLKNIDRKELKVKGDEFDEDVMGKAFSRPKQIQNTLDAIVRLAYNKKILCFNANIEHSLKMHKACLEMGWNSRHLDSDKGGKHKELKEGKDYSSDKYRDDCFKWIENTPNAILHNVGIATIGTDIPSLECVILNSSMMSLSYHIQKAVRGSRPYIYPDGTPKTHFTLLDMGDNCPATGGNLGTPNDDIDWEFIFNNPKLPRPGIGSYKSCPECGGLNHISARFCQALAYDFLSDEDVECGYAFPVAVQEEDMTPKEMVLITDSIDVKKNIEFFKDRKEYFAYFEAFKQIAALAKSNLPEYIDSIDLGRLLNIAIEKATQWFKIKGKRKFPNFVDGVKNELISALKMEGFIIPVEEIIE